MSAQPPAGPPPGPSIGPPGGVFGPPGGLPPPPLPPLPQLPPLAIAPMPGPGGAAPGGPAVPGGAAPLALPDLQAAARAAMARAAAVQSAPAGSADRAAGEPPSVVELANRARLELEHGVVADPPAEVASATAPADVRFRAPGPSRAVPGVWRPPPPPPPPPPGWVPQQRRPLDRSSWPGAEVVPAERDRAQRIGDRLYPLVERIRESRAGWVGVVALFGITVPIILLRQRFDVRWRVFLSFLTVWFWLQLLSELFGG